VFPNETPYMEAQHKNIKERREALPFCSLNAPKPQRGEGYKVKELKDR